MFCLMVGVVQSYALVPHAWVPFLHACGVLACRAGGVVVLLSHEQLLFWSDFIDCRKLPLQSVRQLLRFVAQELVLQAL